MWGSHVEKESVEVYNDLCQDEKVIFTVKIIYAIKYANNYYKPYHLLARGS